jgi:hypothetical protein
MRTPVPRPIPERENITANSKVTYSQLTPEELEHYRNLPLPTDRYGKMLKKSIMRNIVPREKGAST